MEGDDDNIGRGVTAQVAEGYGAVVGVFFQQTGEITCHVARLDALADGGSVAADEKLGQFVSRVSFDARGGDAVQKVGIGIGGRHRDVGGFGGKIHRLFAVGCFTRIENSTAPPVRSILRG